MVGRTIYFASVLYICLIIKQTLVKHAQPRPGEHCVQKKRDENVFFRNISHKTLAVLSLFSGEVENIYIFCSKFIRETVYQILLKSPDFL